MLIDRRLAVVALSLMLGNEISAQSPGVGAGSLEAQLVAQAESEGAKHSRIAPPEEPGIHFRGGVSGASDRRCVEGLEFGPVRSGEFVIGGQLGGTRGPVAGIAAKIWWKPLHSSRAMPTLLVSGRNLADSTDTFGLSSGRIGWNVPAGADENEYFFPSTPTIPHAGRWLLVASSGPNWGCFILTVAR